MKLTGDTFKPLRDALLDAFNENSLRAMLRIQLETDLDRIVEPNALETRVENLIHWAEQYGRTQDLLPLQIHPKTTNLQHVSFSVVKIISNPLK